MAWRESLSAEQVPRQISGGFQGERERSPATARRRAGPGAEEPEECHVCRAGSKSALHGPSLAPEQVSKPLAVISLNFDAGIAGPAARAARLFELAREAF